MHQCLQSHYSTSYSRPIITKPGRLPPENEHRGDGRQEVPQVGLEAQQPVHVQVAGNGHTQVLIVGRHLLCEHDLEVTCKSRLHSLSSK